ncbi:hypothetical protein KC614_01680 [candidate division WWE3 bacterium]|uniref:Glycosyltransferase family 2 protein n=1 Tax=candidate division WWE3 bacterium TaxID=2053526 RepID=A0A955LL70_UNCKA|nr:hypothetical protein [candidate division WWE3 bacterium]
MPTDSKEQTNKPDRSVNRSERLLEMVPGLLTWFVLTSPIWLAFNVPTVMAFLILFLDIYWLYRAVKTAILSVVGYRRMRKAVETDWMGKLEDDFPQKWQELEHVFIIPTWRERGYIIETTFKGMSESEYPMDHVSVILCLEERDDDDIKAEKRAVAEKYRKIFKNVYVTEHPDGLVGEVIGPGSNRTWALKHLYPQLESEMDLSKTILTTLDADFVIHPKLLSALTYKYLSTDEPENKSFTGVFIYSNNYWDAPAPMRLIASTMTINQLAELVEHWKYVTFSSHSLNLKKLAVLDYWTIDHVNDDSHLYWKAFYQTQGRFQVVPHWIPIYADTVLDSSLKKTYVNQYKQLQRWAYGVEHIPYIIKKTLELSGPPVIQRIERLLYVMRANLFWATIAYVTGFGALMLVFVNSTFADTVLGNNLVYYSSGLLSLAIVGLLPLILLNSRVFPSPPKEWKLLKKALAYLQFFLSPFVLMTFGSIPAIDSQTRLMFGKYLTYRVTRKFRKGESSE